MIVLKWQKKLRKKKNKSQVAQAKTVTVDQWTDSFGLNSSSIDMSPIIYITSEHTNKMLSTNLDDTG